MWLSSFSATVLKLHANDRIPMAPGNLQANHLGFQRNKFVSKPYPLRNSTYRICTGNMDVSTDIDDIQKIDIEKPVNGDSENNPNFDPNFNQSLPNKGREGGGDNGQRESWNTEKKLRTQIRNLKSLSMLHLDVIDQQQKQLASRSHELSKVRGEKYTLQQRLERIQRRTSLAEKSFKNNHQTPNNKPPSETTAPLKRKLEAFTSPTVSKRVQSSVKDCTTPAASKQSKLQEDSSKEKKSQKKPRKEDGDRKERAKSKDETKEEERDKDKNDKCPDTRMDKDEKKKTMRLENKYLFTQTLYPTLQDLRVELPDPELPKNESSVEVPSWRTSYISAEHMTDNSEDECDEAYERRHSKMEQEEKKRKRWDAQRIRELRTIERVEWKAVQKEMAKWAHILTSYNQDPNDAKKIEVSKSIPVVAFGAVVPKLKSRSFSLSWFDLEERERDESRRQTRSRSSKK